MCPELRKKLHVVLVRPEESANVGSAARAFMNMGFEGTFRIVGAPAIVDERARALARHAKPLLEAALHFSSLRLALSEGVGDNRLSIAASARSGSAGRPHPIRAREAMERAVQKLRSAEVSDLLFVFGPESDGLQNDDIAECDWIATIPSAPQYRSLNLAQSVLLFCYEANMNLLAEWQPFRSESGSQKKRLVSNILQLAEESGFILPGDPYKMRPRLEGIFSSVPNHIPEVKTLHGLLDQIRRSLRRGEPDIRGRFRRRVEDLGNESVGRGENDGKS